MAERLQKPLLHAVWQDSDMVHFKVYLISTSVKGHEVKLSDSSVILKVSTQGGKK